MNTNNHACLPRGATLSSPPRNGVAGKNPPAFASSTPEFQSVATTMRPPPFICSEFVASAPSRGSPKQQQQQQQHYMYTIDNTNDPETTTATTTSNIATRLENVKLRDSYDATEHEQCGGWTLAWVNVATLPSYHRLEKHSAYFASDQLVPVLRGLQNLFRVESLVVEYRNGGDAMTTCTNTTSSNTVSARCTSMEGVTFVVQIWNDPTHTKQYVLEIQRTGGDTLLYYQHQYAKRILCQLAHVMDEMTASSDYTMPEKTLPIDDPLDFSLENLWEDQKVTDLMMRMLMTTCGDLSTAAMENHVPSAMSIAAELLSSPQRFDQVAMGLESLLTLTNPHQAGLAVAQQAAAILLTVPTETPCLADTIAYLAFSGRPLPTLPDEDALFAHYHASTALRVVAQASQLASPDVLVAFYHRTAAQHPTTFPSTLWTHIQNASAAPHAAYVSTQILVALGRVGLLPLSSSSSSDAVQHAHVVGARCHAALEQASQRLLLQVVVSGGSSRSSG